ncbi:hypothetical protein N9F64_00230 [bacterium]|nr:hypothetical protein [bacterium]
MIGKDGLENQKDINKELDATQKALREANAKAAQLTEESRSLTDELRDQLGIRSKNSEGDKTLLSLSQSITKSAQENKVSLRESGDITKQLGKDEKTLEAAKREQLILTNSILGTDKDLNKLILEEADNIVNANSARTDSVSKIDKLKQQLVDSSKEEEEAILNSISLEQDKLNTAEEDLRVALETADADSQRIAFGKQLVNTAGKNVKTSKEQEESQKRINKSLGIAGGLADAFKKSFGGVAQAIGIDKVAKDMKDFATKADDAGKKVSRLQVLGVGMVSAFKGLGNTLTDPSFLLTNLIKGFNEVDKVATDFQQQTGQDLNTMSTSLNQFNGGLITSAEYIKTASDLTKEFGVNAAAVFTPENLSEAASMTKEMGLAGKEAANLARLSKVNGGNIEAQNEAIISGINSANRQNKTAVAHGQVLRDVANVSDGIAISYAGFPDKLGEAAAAARGLGMSLGDVDKIASSLLDFQSSIEAEMQAELLTGRSLNLEKARELALNNDLAGVAKELANQGITSANFSTMNRIQQEAQAKALGMSRDEMARMLLSQEMQNGLSEGALNDAQKATLEDLKRVDAQEKFATAIAKLQQALAPIVGLFADIASNSIVIYSALGVALFTKMPSLVKGAQGVAGGFKSALSNFGKLSSGISKMVKGGGTGRLKAAAKSMTPTKGADKAADASKKLGKTGSGGAGVKKSLQGLAAGLRSMGRGPVRKGAINLGIFGIAAIPAVASIPFLAFIGLVPLTALTANFTALSTGLNSMSSTFSGIGALSLLALAGILMIPGSVGLALFGGASYIAAAGITVLIPALVALGTAMVSGVGAIGLAALIAMGVGLGISFTLIGAGAMMMGKGIQFAADGFATLFDAITFEKVALLPMAGLGFAALALGIFSLVPAAIFMPFVAFGLGLLGLALLPLGIAVEKLAPNITMLSSSLLPLAAAAPALFTVGASLGSIALGLTAISLAGFFALPIIGALTALGAVSGGLSSIFGGSEEEGAGSKKKESEMSGVEAKLDKLISIVEAGGDVFIDGNKVGKTIQLSSSKIG